MLANLELQSSAAVETRFSLHVLANLHAPSCLSLEEVQMHFMAHFMPYVHLWQMCFMVSYWGGARDFNFRVALTMSLLMELSE